MTIRTTPWPAGTPCWVDMSVADMEATQAFYGPVLDWTFHDMGEQYGHYTMCRRDGHDVAALMASSPETGGPMPWTVYVATDDAAATAKSVVAHGGTLVVEPMEVAGNGVMAVAVDPCGAAFGLWQAGGMPGFGLANEPGSVCWTDARDADAGRGMAFYADVFGYTYEAVPPMEASEYGIAHVAGVEEPVGGFGGLTEAPPGSPSHWLTYFAVADLDDTARQVEAHGGSVAAAPEDTPFGRIGIYTDPFGNQFSLVQPPAA